MEEVKDKDKARLITAITALLVLVAVLFLALVGVCLYDHIKGCCTPQ